MDSTMVSSFPSKPELVDTGHCAIKFNKFSGIKDRVFREGFHLMIPWFERPIIYDVRTHPTNIQSITGSKGKKGLSNILDL